jgi:hypothetical protein
LPTPLWYCASGARSGDGLALEVELPAEAMAARVRVDCLAVERILENRWRPERWSARDPRNP